LDKLKVPRSTSHTPLIQIILNTNSSFGVMGADSANTTLAELNITPYETDVIPAKFDLDIDLNITQEGVELYWTYDVSLFSAQAIERLNDHLCRLLTALSAVNEEEVALHTLPILSEAEQHHLVHGLNNTKIDYPK
ncbi:condensation domain-containing protein, partial [Pseudoalteromonas sp. MMG022]|uniref:condensation domain-containing protein n=1 Tax=Pseudoalteromonas sp. MMG022 TaxID=2909978 RepID=UPI001F2E3299